MKKQDLKKKNLKELTDHAAQLRVDIADLKRDRYLSDDRNTARKGNLKRELARTLTLIAETPAEEVKKPAAKKATKEADSEKEKK